MKKGFTLIELLAVILVLSVVALIAVPTFIGVVNNVKLQTLKSDAYGLIEAGTLYNAQYSNNNNVRFDINNNIITTTEENKLNYKGKVKQGTVIVSNKGQVTICVTDGKNSAYKNYNDNEVTLVSEKTCSIPTSSYIVYLDGITTITELSNQELTDRLNAMETRLTKLEQENNELKEENNTINNSLTTLSNFALKSELNQLNTNLNSSMLNINSTLSSQIASLKGLNNFKSISVQQTVTLGANEATYKRLTLSIPTGYKLLFYNVAANNADQMMATPYFDQNYFGKTGDQVFTVGVCNPKGSSVTHTITLYGICVKES